MSSEHACAKRNHSKTKRAQIFTIDLIAATAIFIIILFAANWAWQYSGEKMQGSERRSDLETMTRTAMSTLIETEGIPSNWSIFGPSQFNENNIRSLGFVRSGSLSNNDSAQSTRTTGLSTAGAWKLDSEKISKLNSVQSTNHTTFKKLLGIMGPGYEFNLKISLWNGNGYSDYQSIGPTPGNNATNVVRVDRFALVNETRAQLTLKVWQECRGVSC
jgi:hypothetical protein